MLAKRIIPFFLLKGSRLYKGTNFKDFIDVGDPVSQGMIYDSQGADEIVIVDIEASLNKRLINTSIIEKMITKCRLPICAGGGISSVADAAKCFESGVDKILVNTHAVSNPFLIKELVREFGTQSVVVSLDVIKEKDYAIYIYSGKKRSNVALDKFIKKIADDGAGEIIVTLIDREGTLSGFDLGLYQRINKGLSVPLIASGGAGCYDDMVALFEETGCDACAIGKMVFLRDYDIVRIKSYLKGKNILVREA